MPKKSTPKTSGFDQKDIEENKVVAALSYIWILCLVPLLLKQNSPYAKFHAKQGLTLLVVWIVFFIVGIVPILGWLIWFLGMITITIISLLGVIKTLNGEAWKIPYIYEWSKQWNL